MTDSTKSKRELIQSLAANGKSLAEIASILGCAYSTVVYHTRSGGRGYGNITFHGSLDPEHAATIRSEFPGVPFGRAIEAFIRKSLGGTQ